MKAMVDTIRIKAEQGNPDYQYAYGMCLEKGYGVEKNERQALDWFKKAAEQNCAPEVPLLHRRPSHDG